MFFKQVNSLPADKLQEIQKAIELFSVGQGPAKTMEEATRRSYQFWDTQPVPKLGMTFVRAVSSALRLIKDPKTVRVYVCVSLQFSALYQKAVALKVNTFSGAKHATQERKNRKVYSFSIFKKTLHIFANLGGKKASRMSCIVGFCVSCFVFLQGRP